MKLDFNAMLFAISEGLDAVEMEITNVDAQHGGHVAYISLKIAEQLGCEKEDLYYIASAAILHDNAVTEYIAEERGRKISVERFVTLVDINKLKINYASLLNSSFFKNTGLKSKVNSHCIKGEQNIKQLPFYDKIENAILYHHENYDGSGPFGIKGDQSPLFAQIIRLSDFVDMYVAPNDFTEQVYDKLVEFLKSKKDILFSSRLVDAFVSCVKFEDMSELFEKDAFDLIREILPPKMTEFSNEEVRNFAGILAKITDYKSHFTSCHSFGIADKVYRMGEYYGYDDDLCTRLYLAGALHDIGKLKTPIGILEKPDKLTPEEFEIMKKHAVYSYEILKNFRGMEEEMSWAYLHHEKLDGNGYPFGKGAEELDKHHRLMACVDIYQALTETRPYKDGFSHEKAISILRDMVEKNQVDREIVEDLDKCFA